MKAKDIKMNITGSVRLEELSKQISFLPDEVFVEFIIETVLKTVEEYEGNNS